MKVHGCTFESETNDESKNEILTWIADAVSLEDLFEQWFFTRGGRLGLGVAMNDDGSLNPDVILLCFDTKNGEPVCTIELPRGEVVTRYPSVIPFDSFVKGWSKNPTFLELHEKKFEMWMKGLGFAESFALMGVIGPRRAAIPLMLSFALSKGGMIEARHIRREDYPDEDYEMDLEEEGIDLDDHFALHAWYAKDPRRASSSRSVFHPFYCRKSD
jgi:hypothetical protein